MGQYYIIANLDKKEYIDPSKFGEERKLMEFVSDQFGALSGLGILLADGNGRGGGDLDKNTCFMEPKELKQYGVVNIPTSDINKMTVPQLKKVASTCKIKGISGMNKSQLKAAILSNKCETDPLKITEKALSKKGLRIESSFVYENKRCDIIVPKEVGRWAGDRIVIAGNYADDGKFVPIKAKINDNLYSWARKRFKDVSKDVIRALEFNPYVKKMREKRKKLWSH